MAKREDGRETHLKLLIAGAEVFAQKGYRRAKVAEICRLAGANVASVNYYFGDKANLYVEVWQHVLQNLDEGVFSEKTFASPQERLRQFIQETMQNFTAQGGLGQLSRLYLMELVNPTGLIHDTWHEIMEPRRQRLHAIIREIIGPDADQQSVLFCELSIVNQCRALVTVKANDLEYLLGKPLSPELIKRLACHVADFSLAGIKAIGQTGK